MFCGQCGKSIPVDAKFCCYCGGNVQGGTISEESVAWEYCEVILIKTERIWGIDHMFEAEAIGPKGVYCAGQTPQIKLLSLLNIQGFRIKLTKAYEVLINQLVQEGWELTGELGNDWWRKKFRRKVKST